MRVWLLNHRDQINIVKRDDRLMPVGQGDKEVKECVPWWC